MKSHIKEICFRYIESNPIKHGEEYERLNGEVNKISKGLDKKHQKIFDEIFDLQFHLLAEVEFEYFLQGFKYGYTLATETVLD